jgi:hypothetical protein
MMRAAGRARTATRPGPVLLCAVVLAAAACAPPGAPQPTPPHLAQLREWRFQVAEHVALWYFGLAHTGTPILERASSSLPLHDTVYARQAAADKRARGIAPTPLEQRAAEFGAAFRRSAAFGQLEFLPLYFEDHDALVAAIRVWTQVGGDPRRAGSAPAANVVALLSGMFPQAAERDLVAAFMNALVEERTRYFATHWAERRSVLERAASLAQLEWNALAPVLRPVLAYLNLEGGDVFLAPTLGAEGRILPRGAGRPRAAVRIDLPDRLDGTAPNSADTAAAGAEARAAAKADAALFGFLSELLYPLAGEAVREHLAPARVRELGVTRLEQHAAVRAADMLLARVAPDRRSGYQRHYLVAAGGDASGDDAALTQRFAATFALPSELEAGLDATLTAALAGI